MTAPRRVRYRQPQPLPPEFYESSRPRIAMGERDVQGVFLVLGRLGISQRHIAALTGQSQSEISEIRAGRRVQSIDLIERIADGLRTPRGWWGLAHTDDAIAPRAVPAEDHAPAAEIPPTRTIVAPAPSAQHRPEPSPIIGRVSPADLAAARHLLGLISAIRVALAPRATVLRPSRASIPARSSGLRASRRT